MLTVQNFTTSKIKVGQKSSGLLLFLKRMLRCQMFSEF